MAFRPRLRFRPGLVNEPPKASKSRLAAGKTRPTSRQNPTGHRQNSTGPPAKLDRPPSKTRPGHQLNSTDLPYLSLFSPDRDSSAVCAGQRPWVPVASLHEVAPLLSLHNHVHHLAFGLVVHSV